MQASFLGEVLEKVLKLSIELGKPIIIIYMGKKGISRRKIKLIRIEDKRIYAYCFLREKYRYFVIDNILSAQLAD